MAKPIILSSIFLSLFLGSVNARSSELDINRVKLLAKEGPHHDAIDQKYTQHYRFSRNNDYNDQGYDDYYLPANYLSHQHHSKKVHQPREDPGLYYQSEAYRKDIQDKESRSVSFIYPGMDMIRAADKDHSMRSMLRSNDKERGYTYDEGSLCMRCPRDRMLIAKPNSDRVVLQSPRLHTCKGKIAKKVHFTHMYGPKLGSLVGQGSHSIVGKITHRGKTLRLCKINFHVILQYCPVPNNLIAHCKGKGEPCNFTCRYPKHELHGTTFGVCGDDLQWKDELPICKVSVRAGCELQAPEHGQMSCSGNTNNGTLVEGSRCRVRCDPGYRRKRHSKSITACRRGSWTNTLACEPKRNHVATI